MVKADTYRWQRGTSWQRGKIADHSLAADQSPAAVDDVFYAKRGNDVFNLIYMNQSASPTDRHHNTSWKQTGSISAWMLTCPAVALAWLKYCGEHCRRHCCCCYCRCSCCWHAASYDRTAASHKNFLCHHP